MFGMEPKKMQQMMKQLGMKMDNIPASQVIIKTDAGDIVVEEPQVVKTTMQGQIVFQVSGNVKEKSFSGEDVKLVMEQSGTTDKDLAAKALQEANGDVVKAIMKLKGE
jgi:nascent polypeptide-associated complex subunit alpha